MTEIEIPPGYRVQTHEPAPTDFDPLTAPESLLLRYGYPPRPGTESEPELHKRWEQMCLLLRRTTYIVPTFQVIEGMKHGLRRTSEIRNGTPAFSGSLIHADTGQRFVDIVGDWNVPNPYPPSHLSKGEFYASQWVGIDADPSTSNSLIQAGTLVEIATDWDSPVCYAWWEWYPANQVIIENFRVVPGDLISCTLQLLSPDRTTVLITIVNHGVSVSTSFKVTPPPSVSPYVGDRAQWVVERPMVNGLLTNLARYGRIYIGGVAGYITSAVTGSYRVAFPDSGYLFPMVVGDNIKISVPVKLSPGFIMLYYYPF